MEKVWRTYLLPYVVRKCALRIQLGADKNASELIEKERFGLAIMRQIRLPVQYGIRTTWSVLLRDALMWPKINEGLRNLYIEPEEIEIQFKEQPSKDK